MTIRIDSDPAEWVRTAFRGVFAQDYFKETSVLRPGPDSIGGAVAASVESWRGFTEDRKRARVRFLACIEEALKTFGN